MTDADRQRPPYRGGATTYAEEHRAFARVERPGVVVAQAVGLGAVSLALWVAALPAVSRLWGHALAALAPAVGASGVRMAVTDAWGLATVGVPYLDLAMGLPGPLALWATGFAVLVLWAASAFLPERWRPGVYLLRAVLLVQASAVVYFAVWPDLWPYTLADYLHGMTAAGLAIATATPVALALALHVQDLALWRKAGFTALALGYSVVLVPVQYAVQGWALSHATALAMPALYLFAGVPLHVFALVALYAWAMSWPGRLPALGVPDEDLAPLPTPVDVDRAPVQTAPDAGDTGTPVFEEADPDDLELTPAQAAARATRAEVADPFGLAGLDAGAAPVRPALFSAGGDGAAVVGRLDLPPAAPTLSGLRRPAVDVPEWTSLAGPAPAEPTPADDDPALVGATAA